MKKDDIVTRKNAPHRRARVISVSNSSSTAQVQYLNGAKKIY